MSSNESVFVHFISKSECPSREGTAVGPSAASLGQTDSFNLELDPFPNVPSYSVRPKTRRGSPPPNATHSLHQRMAEGEEAVSQLRDGSLKDHLLANFRTAKAEINKLSSQMTRMRENEEEDRHRLLRSLNSLQNELKEVRKEKAAQKESYLESLQEIEDKASKVAAQLTNVLIENACLREENGELREDQTALTDRVGGLERKLEKLDGEQPRVKALLHSLERREQGLKLQLKRLAQLDQTHRAIASEPVPDEEAYYESVTEKARAILRRERIPYQVPTKTRGVTCVSSQSVPVSVSTASTSTQPQFDAREEEEEILRTLFFPF